MRLLRRAGVAGTSGLDLLPRRRGAIIDALSGQKEKIWRQACAVLLEAVQIGAGMRKGHQRGNSTRT